MTFLVFRCVAYEGLFIHQNVPLKHQLGHFLNPPVFIVLWIKSEFIDMAHILTLSGPSLYLLISSHYYFLGHFLCSSHSGLCISQISKLFLHCDLCPITFACSFVAEDLLMAGSFTSFRSQLKYRRSLLWINKINPVSHSHIYFIFLIALTTVWNNLVQLFVQSVL